MKKEKQSQLCMLLQVGDLTIASADQVPYLDMEPINASARVINFLRSGCPAVQVEFTHDADEDDREVRKLKALLDAVSLPGESFEVSEPGLVPESYLRVITIIRKRV